MKIKNKLLLLSFLTLGIYYAIIKTKAKKAININTELTYSKKINFEISDFIDKVGGKQNIRSIKHSLNSITFEINNSVNIDKREQQKFGIKGIMKGYKKITFIFGDNAKAIYNKINNI
ncbi:MAG: hypothetical protein LBS95_00105 [Mycoplasmataceae bacterium]|jgi:phosphotransferase system IIB component|nr:hypothetical protein [Mycoplasmataceae bacterium]